MQKQVQLKREMSEETMVTSATSSGSDSRYYEAALKHSGMAYIASDDNDELMSEAEVMDLLRCHSEDIHSLCASSETYLSSDSFSNTPTVITQVPNEHSHDRFIPLRKED